MIQRFTTLLTATNSYLQYRSHEKTWQDYPKSGGPRKVKKVKDNTSFFSHCWYCHFSSHWDLGQRENKCHSRNQQCDEIVLGRGHQPPQREPTDLTGHHLETIRQENPDKGEPSGGETTWTNTGRIRSGRGQRNLKTHKEHKPLENLYNLWVDTAIIVSPTDADLQQPAQVTEGLLEGVALPGQCVHLHLALLVHLGQQPRLSTPNRRQLAEDTRVNLRLCLQVGRPFKC